MRTRSLTFNSSHYIIHVSINHGRYLPSLFLKKSERPLTHEEDKGMKKRLLTVLLAVILVMALGTIAAFADDEPVASVNGTEYGTLQAAIDAAESIGGGTIVLLRDVNSGEVTFDSSGEYVLDLANHTFTSSEDDIIEVRAGNLSLTVRDGILRGPNSGTYGIYVYSTNNNVTIALESVYLHTTDQGLGVQGLNTNNNLLINNSTIVCEGTAVYFPPISGSMIIEDSAITGVNNGIVLKGGTTIIRGNTTVSATGDGIVPSAPYGGTPGTDFPTTGAAIYVEGGYSAGSTSRPIELYIEGGIFESSNAQAAVYDQFTTGNTNQSVEVTGGSFTVAGEKSDVEKYIPTGAAIIQNNSGTIILNDAVNVVASVNGIGYNTLVNAINAAKDGDTVTLLQSTTEDTIKVSEDNDISLDLGGNTLNLTQYSNTGALFGSSSFNAMLFNVGTLSIENGRIEMYNSTEAGNGIVNSGNLTLTSDVDIVADVVGEALINVNGSLTSYADISNIVATASSGWGGAITTYGGILNLSGGNITAEAADSAGSNLYMTGLTVYNSEYNNISDGAEVTLSNVDVTADVYAISTNNLNSGGVSPSNVTINSGSFTSTQGTAIYWPSAGRLTVGVAGGNDASVSITANEGSGIEICSGELIVNCGTVYGGYEYTGTDDDLLQGYRGHSGSAGIGDAITVIGRRGSGYDTASLNVVINGGRFQSGSNYGVRYFDCNLANATQITQIVEVEITDGTFVGAAGDVDFAYVNSEEQQIIAGGNFSEPVDLNYLSDNLTVELYSVSNTEAPYSYYRSTEDAQNAAQTGDIITDLSSVTSDVMHMVTIDYGYMDKIVISMRDQSVLILPTPDSRSGYRFAGWRDAQGNRYEAGQAITVYSDMTLTAMWNAVNVPDTTYPITIADTDNGTVSTNLTNASAGATITITAEPDEGYSVGRVVVTGPDGRLDVTRVNATTYTFKMPEGDVEVEVEFVSGEEALPFTDVTAGAWYYDAVSYVYFNGMMEGDSATTFNPDGTMTRAMFWAVLGRIDGASITGSNWAEAAREWAVTNGVSDGENASGLVTREQMVTMLWRYAGEPESSYSLSAYSDAASVSDWAEEAMSWALENGIIEGMTATTLEPQSTATRAQCATIFMRYDALEE